MNESSPAPRHAAGPRTLSTPAAAAAHFDAVRERSLALVEPLSAEDCQVQSMPDASPTKWHLAHTTWFFETFVLERFESGFKPFDACFRVLFNSYYQGIGAQHPRAQRGLVSRPGLPTVLSYRRHVDERIRALLARHGDDASIGQLVELGLNHEQQHQELILTDIKHALSCSPTQPAYCAADIDAEDGSAAAEMAWLHVVGGLVEIGHDAQRDGRFYFDNEAPRHRTLLRDFSLASRCVTNGEYQAFIDDGGYRNAALWLSMGWDWVRAREHREPLYWDMAQASLFTLRGRRALDAAAPVCHLSYFEADAYARWANARLPTEAEWEHAARQFAASADDGQFADDSALHPRTARALRAGTVPLQMFGSVWEWTQSAYAAYPGYRPAAGAVGEYNGKFMCNQFVLRGGSCATPRGHVRASYRNFFPPDAQWQFSGLRLARER